MAVRPILKYPHSSLSTPCEPVVHFDEALRQLVEDLADTMHAAPGVGITAAHIGVLLRVTVIELSGEASRTVLVNPEILSFGPTLSRNTEGSVSMPGFTEEVERPSTIRYRYQDLMGALHEADADGFLAICIQHEIDQLDGIFWLKRLSRLKRERLTKKWEKQNA